MIYDLQQTDDPRDIVHRSVQTLVEGGVIGLPSETVYGVVASALCVDAVKQLVEIISGGNSPDNLQWGQIALCVRSSESAGDFILPQTLLARRLTERCFPGPLTLVSDCSGEGSAMSMLPQEVQQFLRKPTEQAGRVGELGSEAAFRVSKHRLLSHIHRYLSAPLIWGELATESGSSSSSGPIDRGATTITALTEQINRSAPAANLPLLLDDGVSRYGGAGTVVRAAGNTWQILREGVIQRAAMNQFVKPVIAIVCTGNTCRSPMAETLLRDLLHKKFGREDVVRVISAGVAAGRGSGAAPQSVEVMGRLGLDLTGHCSQPLDDPLMSMSDLVLTMTRRHRDAILAAWPDRKDRVFTLRRDGGDISDPVGMPVEIYEQCAQQMRGELEQWIEALDDDFFPNTSDNAALERHNAGEAPSLADDDSTSQNDPDGDDTDDPHHHGDLT